MRDIEIINRNAESLNQEALDVLSYQDLPLDDGLSPEFAETEPDATGPKTRSGC